MSSGVRPPTPTVSDEALVEAATAFARRFARRPEDVDDIAQEALLRLLQHGAAVLNPVAWLYVVIRRLDRARFDARHPATDPPPTVDPWPEIELGIDVGRLLARLSRRAGGALRLSLAGFSEIEAARALHCSVKALEKTLNKARVEARRMRRGGTQPEPASRNHARRVGNDTFRGSLSMERPSRAMATCSPQRRSRSHEERDSRERRLQMAKNDPPTEGPERSNPSAKQIVDATLRSGVIDTKQSIDSLVGKIGGGLDEVAGYVLAWERYVLVVRDDFQSPVIRFERR